MLCSKSISLHSLFLGVARAHRLELLRESVDRVPVITSLYVILREHLSSSLGLEGSLDIMGFSFGALFLLLLCLS